MALKATLTATEFEALDEGMKEHYAIQPDMSYNIDLGEGVFIDNEDPQKLKASLQAEREETKKAKAAADRLEKEKLQAERDKLTDAEEIKAHYEKQLTDEKKRQADEQKAAEKQRLESQTQMAESLRKAKALELTSSLFGKNTAIMLPHVENMLKAVPGDSPSVQIVDPTTGLPALDQNFDNFKQSLSTNELYSPMVIVSQASGGGANGAKSTGLPSGTRDDGKPKTYSDYTPGELLSIKKENPEQFKKLKSTR